MKHFKNYKSKLLALAVLFSLFVVACSDENNPTGDFTYSIDSENVTFVASGVNGVSVEWDFGDGTESSISFRPKHTYAVSGDYTVTLTIFGDEGTTPAVVEKTITVHVPVFVPITVVNGGFETTDGLSDRDWQSANVPGWNSDAPTGDSGVEYLSPNESRGVLKTSEASAWQLTDHEIAEGEEFKLTAIMADIWNSPNFIVTLYYDTGDGVRNVLATKTIAVASGEQNSVEFTATATAAAAGARLGIEFDNTSNDGGDGWLSFNNVQLFVLQ